MMMVVPTVGILAPARWWVKLPILIAGTDQLINYFIQGVKLDIHVGSGGIVLPVNVGNLDGDTVQCQGNLILILMDLHLDTA